MHILTFKGSYQCAKVRIYLEYFSKRYIFFSLEKKWEFYVHKIKNKTKKGEHFQKQYTEFLVLADFSSAVFTCANFPKIT